MVRVWLISLTYFPTLYLLTSVFFPVNNVLHFSPLIVFRYLFLSVITFLHLENLFENSWNHYYAL